MKDLVIRDIEGLHELSKAVGDSAYLLVKSSSINYDAPIDSVLREIWVTKVAILNSEAQILSQYLRRLLAKKLGNDFEWDWAIFPKIDAVQNLIQRFKIWIEKQNKYNVNVDTDGKNRSKYIDWIENSNRVGNNNIAQDFHRTWVGRIQYRTIGKFLKSTFV